MRKQNKLIALLALLVSWAILAAIFWCWIFTFLTDPPNDQKVTLYVDATACRETDLALRLEQDVPEGVRMVKVHRFSYAMFGGDELRASDLYLIREPEKETCMDWLAPLPESYRDRADLFAPDGTPVGILVYDSATGTGFAPEYMTFAAPGEEDTKVWLAFGAGSPRLEASPDGPDEAVTAVARTLLTMMEPQ